MRRRHQYYELRGPDWSGSLSVDYGLPLEDAESVRDLFAVIRNHRSEYVSEGVQQVLGRASRDFADWARATAKTGVWSA